MGNVQPYDILKKLDELAITKDDSVYFISDIKELFLLCYRIYHQLFTKFIFCNYIYDNNMRFDDVFSAILKYKIQDEEAICKSIYTNDTIDESYMKYCKPLICVFDTENDTIDDSVVQKKQKLYYLQGQYILYEPIDSKDLCIINLQKNIELKPLNYDLLVFGYYNNAVLIDKMILNLDLVYKGKMNLVDAYDAYHEFEDYINSIAVLERRINYFYIWSIGMNDQLKDRFRIMLFSILVFLAKDKLALTKILEIAITSKELTMYNRYYIWNQVK